MKKIIFNKPVLFLISEIKYKITNEKVFANGNKIIFTKNIM